MIHFTEEQWREIDEVRSRLEDWRNKIQPYPSYSEEERSEALFPLIRGSEPQWSGTRWDLLRQLQNEVRGWRKKHAEVMLKLDRMEKKDTYKYE